MTAARPETVVAALNSAARLLDACDRLGHVLDNAPPLGIRRPNPADLIEHDEISAICADLRIMIRARIDAAKAAVRVWEPSGRP